MKIDERSIMGLKSNELHTLCEKEKNRKKCKMPLKSILAILEREK